MTRVALLGSIVAAVAVAAVAVAIGAIVISGGESAGPEQGITLSEVARHPSRYDGRSVRISGEWAENRYFSPADASQVIVIGDDAGTRLVAVPDLGVAVPRLDEDTVVQITGEVHALAGQDAAAGYVQPGGILADQPVVVAAHGVATSPPRRVTSRPEPVGATIAQIIRDPRAWDGQRVVVRGTASPSGRGFLLRAGDRSIFVSAPSSQLRRIAAGDVVRIRARVQRLSGLAGQTLERAIRTDPPTSQPDAALALERLPIDPGEPYLLLRAVLEG